MTPLSGVVVGYFLGKFTYAETCADKFLTEAPDSNLAAAIRARRGLPPRDGAGQLDSVILKNFRKLL